MPLTKKKNACQSDNRVLLGLVFQGLVPKMSVPPTKTVRNLKLYTCGTSGEKKI